MSVKGMKPVIGGRYKQGYYSVINKDKYIGFTAAPIFRSSLELELFRILDTNSVVVRWTSESDQTIIKYRNPFFGKKRGKRVTTEWFTYHPDAYVELRDGSCIRKYVVEVKPESKMQKPVASDDIRTKIEYIIVKAKEEAAKEWCKARDMEYIIVTEKSIHRLKSRH
jgi:hypothetical protein